MSKELYVVYPFRSPEDYVLVLAETDEEIVKEFCDYSDMPLMDVEEFFEDHNADIAGWVNGRKIKEIILE